MTEQVIKGDIAIIKHTDDGETQIETPETGAEFQIYLKAAGSYDAAKESERDVLTCDENGFCTVQDAALWHLYRSPDEGLGRPRADGAILKCILLRTARAYRYLINNAQL